MLERLSDLSGRSVSRETYEKLDRYVTLLLSESERQNLISATTVADVWERHIADGAQLIRFAPSKKSWLDIGSGAGLPGLVIAIIAHDPITLVEPRRLRADFLKEAAISLELPNVTVVHGKVDAVAGSFDLITARAVARLEKLFAWTAHLAHASTLWILPKGAKAKLELDEARLNWQGAFSLEASATSSESSIVLARGVKPRGRGKP